VSPPNTWTWLLAGLAFIAHVAVGVLYAASGLLAPLWAVVLLDVWWIVLAVVLVRLARHGSWWTPAVPVVAYGTWWAALTAGEQVLGWTG
jgi:hypothetical protein